MYSCWLRACPASICRGLAVAPKPGDRQLGGGRGIAKLRCSCRHVRQAVGSTCQWISYCCGTVASMSGDTLNV
eukprot:5970627-Heterocapsa_arctica.AAC.1